ncbi:MAG: BMP family protein [Rhodospirillaceae bacterium]|nr:BMP family protein [Rhodospirillaceae bacterium]
MRRIIAAAAAAIAIACAGSAGAETKQLRVALVLPGPITDGTFNTAAYQGIKAAEKKYNIKVSVQENTTFAQSESALLQYARQGYDVIIGHGFQFGDPAKKIHKRFPKTWFIVNTAKVSGAPNLASFDNRWGDAGYVAGAIAALVTKSGTVGHIGGIPVPVIKEFNEGFATGAKRFNPNIKVLSAFVGSFSDIAKGKEITLSMIERGADVVTATGNESVIGTIQAAKEKKVMAIGTAFDSASFAPDTIVTTAIVRFDVNIDMAIGLVVSKKLEPKTYLLGFNENGLGLAPYGKFDDKISAANKAKIQQLIADIKAGKVADLPKIQ